MSDTNTLDLSNISSDSVEPDVQAEINDVEEVDEVDEQVAPEAEEQVSPEVESSSTPSTEEVVETVQTILTTDAPTVTKTTEEKLDALIELLKSTCYRVEYDDDEYRWVGPLTAIREALNEL